MEIHRENRSSGFVGAIYDDLSVYYACVCIYTLPRVCAVMQRLPNALYDCGHLTVCIWTIPEIDSGRMQSSTNVQPRVCKYRMGEKSRISNVVE